MLRATRHIITLMLALLPVAVLHHSCTEVELCDVTDHPHLATLALKVYWDDVYVADGVQRPDTLMVMAHRVINAWRTEFIVELPEEDGEPITEGLTVFGGLTPPTGGSDSEIPEEDTLPEEPSDSENPENPEEPENPEDPEDSENPENPEDSSDPLDPEDSSVDSSEGELTPEQGSSSEFQSEPLDESSDLTDSEEPSEPNGSEGSEDSENPSDSEVSDAPSNPSDLSNNGPMRLKGGEYQFIAVSWSSAENEIDSLEKVIENFNIGTEEPFIKFKTYRKDDPKLNSLGRAWIDYNSYGRFMISDIVPTYLGLAGVHTVHSGRQEVVEIRPKRITQRYNLLFSIKKEPGVRIEQVIAVIAGIPYRFGLSTRNVDVAYTNKMAFTADIHPDTVALYPDHYTGQPDALDNDTVIYYQGLFNSIGLVRSNSPSRVYGPGILQLCIYTSTQRPGSEQRVNRTIYGMINLYNTINEAHPMHVTADGKYMQQNGDSITLDIATVLEIENGEILESNTESGTLDTWKEAHSFNVDM